MKTTEGTPDREKKSKVKKNSTMVISLRHHRIGKPSMYFMYLLYVNYYEAPQIMIKRADFLIHALW
jgi:hypothetical protein